MPESLKPKNLPLKKGDPPKFMHSGDLVACAWHDTKRVHFLSTVQNDLTIDKDIRHKGSEGGKRTVEKPVVAEQYNNNMAGVDRMDQLLGSYAYPHKSQKWYQPIYHRVREIALVNGYIIYKLDKSTRNERILPPETFREQVIDGLLTNWNMTQRKGRPSLQPEDNRLTQRHFPGKYEDAKYFPDCIVCSERKNKKRKQTHYYCKQCGKPMCVVPCFEKYHTIQNV